MSVAEVDRVPVVAACGSGEAMTGGGAPVLSDAQGREIRALARSVHTDCPSASLATIVELAEQAHAGLAQSRVQSFRMILTERAVRRRLAADRVPA